MRRQEYPIVVEKIPDEEGGGFTACFKGYAEQYLVGDGETAHLAEQDLVQFLLSEFIRRITQSAADNDESK